MKVIKLRETRSLKIKEEPYPKCEHLRVTLDEHNRSIECSACGEQMDAFAYLLRWAGQQRRFEMEVEYKKRELANLSNELADLKKSVSYVKKKAKSSVQIIKTG
jgi:hypothetical protein